MVYVREGLCHYDILKLSWLRKNQLWYCQNQLMVLKLGKDVESSGRLEKRNRACLWKAGKRGKLHQLHFNLASLVVCYCFTIAVTDNNNAYTAIHNQESWKLRKTQVTANVILLRTNHVKAITYSVMIAGISIGKNLNNELDSNKGCERSSNIGIRWTDAKGKTPY